MERGIIFDLKEFSVFDGPGIRQTVFLKGCPLLCSWCHNPEGQKKHPQVMATQTECRYCHLQQFIQENNRCCRCAKILPALAKTSGEEISSADLIERLRINSGWYAKYGGGVTFSGGEPLMQPAFLMDVLQHIPDMHTAIETSGYCDSEIFTRIIAQIDYVMLDIKIVDAECHKKYTGHSNDKILHNLHILCNSEKPFTIRIPLIPGVNDNEHNFRQTAELIHQAKSLIKVELLPYHRTAGAKYAQIGRAYQPGFDEQKAIHAPVNIFRDFGIRSEIL